MALSVFNDKMIKPNDESLIIELGPAITLWDDLKQCVHKKFNPVTEDWIYGGKKHGWSLRLKFRKRAILYMTPANHYFEIGFALGEKAFNAILQSQLPEYLIDIVKKAPKYPEGRGVRLEIRNAEDVYLAGKIAEFKMAN